MLPKEKVANVETYIKDFPINTQKVLKQMRSLIKKAAPKADEGIGYQMPAYKLNGKPLVYFAGYENHIGFYPTPSAIEAFKKELSVYKNAKGSVQFPLDKKLPLDLITKIVKFRIKQNMEKQKLKTQDNDFLSLLGAPAKRALENAGINTLQKLSTFTEKEILKLHGMGKSSIPKLQAALKKEGLSFKK